METALNLIKGDSVGSETDYRDALPVNMVAVPRDIFGVKGYMIQYPGLKKIGELSGPCRGGLWNERFKELYRVNSTGFYSVDSFGFGTMHGLVGSGSTVSLPYSFNTQGVVASGRFYLYSPSGGLSEVTDPDLGSPIDCVWVNGYYFFTDGEYIYHTDINDESSINPLKYATAEFMPDDSLGVAKTQDNKVVVFGRYSMEYFIDQGQENFAFRRIESRAIKIGIVGTHCKAESGGKFFILGGRKEESISCHIAGVGSVQKIATREIDKIIGHYNESELATSIVEAYSEDGINFVVYHLPNETLLFNETIASTFGVGQAWTIIDSGTVSSANYQGVHYVNDVRTGKWTLGNKNNGSISELDDTVAEQNGNMARWELYTPFYYFESTSIDELEIEVLPGYNDQGDARVFISQTYNGVTNSQQFIEMYGTPNDYNKRFVVRRLGYVRDWVGFKLRGLTRSRMAFSRALINHG